MKIVIAMSVFNRTVLPTEDSLPSYGNEQTEVKYAGWHNLHFPSITLW